MEKNCIVNCKSCSSVEKDNFTRACNYGCDICGSASIEITGLEAGIAPKSSDHTLMAMRLRRYAKSAINKITGKKEEESTLPKIRDFNHLMNFIAWNWDSKSVFIEYERGNYTLNKVYITPNRVSYKGEDYELDLSIYSKFLQFLRLIDQ